MGKIIEVRNLYKTYYLYNNPRDRFIEAMSFGKKNLHFDKQALSGINFSVETGECVGIIGTNGSGKSTLLKIITGVLTPTSGIARTGGRVAALLELGAGFNKDYTGRENIYLNGRMMRFSREEIDRRIEDIIKFADIGEYIDQPVKTYSSGMFARLAFAVSINVDADILIVDEALSVGDAFFQNKCFRKFNELRENGVTILFVSHDIETVKRWTNRSLWIEQGKQMMFQDSATVCNAYAKSLLLKGNEMAAKSGELNEGYVLGKFELTKFPGIISNNENLLNEDVEIRACFFEDLNGNIEYDLRSGIRYRLVIIFQSLVDIPDCIVGYVLQNKKGESIINSNTLITGRKKNFRVKSKTIVRVEFEMELPQLYSDEYLIDCAVAAGRSVMDSRMLTWCYRALKIMLHNKGDCLALLNTDSFVRIYDTDLN